MDGKTIEELCLNNWQPLSTLLYDGWVLRFAHGYTKRANSINPIHYSTFELEEKIEQCEQMYAAHSLPAIYRISPFVHPVHLDQALEEKGYKTFDHSIVKAVRLDGVKAPDQHQVRIDETLTAEWLDHFFRLSQTSQSYKSVMERMLSNINTTKGFISLYHEGQVVACGLGVIERDYIGLFDIITDAQFRNRGFGEQMILHLLKWGKEKGAVYSHLQVIANNEPALRLYSKIGYAEMYRYWYRVKV
ncbi:GNAT family N-acetyltransferase [Paenibacillus sp. NPDC058174]|uniref:GNAT family N-acetyltransferase n=1 Tax=Paenibacillus sp. NPDC058174 TaxID=3346366 RepID=UPI0036DF4E57